MSIRGRLGLGAGDSSSDLFFGRYWEVTFSRSLRTQDSFEKQSSAAFLNVDIKSGQEFGSSSAHCLMRNERYRTFPSKTLGKRPLISAMSLVIVPENTKTWLSKSLCANLPSFAILRRCRRFWPCMLHWSYSVAESSDWFGGIFPLLSDSGIWMSGDKSPVNHRTLRLGTSSDRAQSVRSWHSAARQAISGWTGLVWLPAH